MTDSAAKTPQASAHPEVLLATKLYLPSLRPGLVPRPRLAEQLEETAGRGVAVVVAPAGYGKTMLLADWVRASGRPAAWLSLDVADNDPARFWRHVVAALETVYPGIGGRVGSLLGPPAPLSFEALVTGLINDIAADPDEREAVLVLDDYHVIEELGVHEPVSFWLEHRPSALWVVIASRSDPPLALARLRGRGQLGEVRSADLRFTSAEAAELLRRAEGRPTQPLPEAAVTALAARTEGWAAGLQLAALSLRGRSDVTGFMDAFTGSHRYVLDYLAEEVLERQSLEMRRFLLETSVLERLSGSLCDAVTGRTDSQARLEQVERARLFLAPLDDIRQWWRYHHLFSDLLRARLGPRSAKAADLHRRAAAWYEERRLADDAIHHALAAGDKTWAARLIETNFDTLYNLRGEGTTIRRWLASLPDNLVACRPRLLLAEAQMAAMLGHVDDMEPRMAAAEHAGQDEHEQFAPTSGTEGSLLVNVPALIALQRSYIAQLHGDADTTATLASRALAQLHDGEWMLHSAIQGFLAVAEWLRGRLSEAERAFTASISGWDAVGQLTTWVWGHYSVASLQRAQGRLDAADQTCRDALELLDSASELPLSASGPALVGLAQSAYQRDELHQASSHTIEGISRCRQWVYNPPLTAGLATLAWIRQATGDLAGAAAAMDEAAELSPGPAGVLNPVPAQQARLWLAQGDLDSALRWTKDQSFSADDEPCYAREPGYLVLARVLLAQGLSGRAVALLERLHAAAVDQNRAGSVIEIGALLARGPGRRGRRRRRIRRVDGCLGAGLPGWLCAGLRRRGPSHGSTARTVPRRTALRADQPGHTSGLSGPAAESLQARGDARRDRSCAS